MTLKDKFVASARAMSFLMAGLSVICSSGCSDDIVPDEVKTAVVNLRLDEALQETAYVRLTHDGSRDDLWCYTMTQDMDADAEELLASYISKTVEADGYIMGNTGTNRNITLEDLDARTSYRLIAGMVSPDGSILGDVAELVFVTLRDPAVFDPHPSWSISYKERRASEDDPDVETEIFGCEVGADTTETYVACLLSKDDFVSSYGGSLRACFEDYVAYRNLENVKWQNVVLNKSSELVEDRLRHGDYIVFMIGVNAGGELTGYYARADVSIVQEVATEEYRKWVGKWTLTGYCDNTLISYQVEISPDENNLYYRMSGWESSTADTYFKNIPSDLPLLLYFEKSTGYVYVVSEELADLSDETLAEFYDFYLFGCVEIDYNGVMTEVPVDVSNLRVARFELLDDNHASATPEIFSFDLGGVHYDAPFLYFNYSYISMLYNALTPLTTGATVPSIDTIKLER